MSIGVAWGLGIGLLALDPQMTAADTTTVLRGVVIDSAARGLDEVELTLLPLGLQVRSDSVGRFRFQLASGGRYRLVARRIGYAPDTFPVTIRHGENKQVALSLTRIAVLARVEVRALAGVLPRVVDRASKGLSTLMLQDEIKAYRIYEVNDLLQYVPRFRGGGLVFIDGRPSRGRIDHPNPSDIVAIELTQGMMGWDEPDLWPPFWLNRSSSIPIVMIWTRAYTEELERRFP